MEIKRLALDATLDDVLKRIFVSPRQIVTTITGSLGGDFAADTGNRFPSVLGDVSRLAQQTTIALGYGDAFLLGSQPDFRR